MFKRLAEWIASIVRKELAELAAACLAVYYLERRFFGQFSRLLL